MGGSLRKRILKYSCEMIRLFEDFKVMVIMCGGDSLLLNN